MGIVQLSKRGMSSASLLDSSLLRTEDMFLFSSTVAADRGTVFLKNERSRTRIARFTGGRNISGFLEVDCLVAMYFESIGPRLPVRSKKTKIGRAKEEIRVDPCTDGDRYVSS